MATKGAEKRTVKAKKSNVAAKSTSTAKKSTATAKKKTATAKKSGAKASPLKDPKGGLTAAGRAAFRKKEGARLRPGVQGAADTPEKQKRKGSFLRRHFVNPRGPMVKDGEPTRLALSAHAWGEPVPKTMADAKKLASKGAKLLERYRKSQVAKAAGSHSRTPPRKPRPPSSKPGA